MIYQVTMRTVSYVEFIFNDYDDNMDAEKAEGNPRKVNTRDPDALVLPKGCFGFRLFDRYEGVCEGKKVSSERVNESDLYLVGVQMSRSEVAEYFPLRDDILKKMDIAEATSVVHCSAPNGDIWHIIEDENEGLIVLSPNQIARA
mgnify:CR=1 FL=1